jgi:phosphoribosylamine--glycine ligase
LTADDLDGLLDFARKEAIDLTIVGPEAPLVAGLVDLFQAAGLAIFGPSRAAAQLEGSKAFSKAFMQRHGIPTGTAKTFDDVNAAKAYLSSLESVPVIKASGLAAGKGVILPESFSEAEAVLDQILVQRQFGEAGAEILIEERMTGPEVSVLAFCDGRNLAVMPTAQDHKRLLDDDQGPNTGGMGAFSPSPLADESLLEAVEATVLRPTLEGMMAEGVPFVGILYAGLMLTEKGPKVLEFNCRFGDPEAQVILPLLEDDLIDILEACLSGTLEQALPSWRNQAAVTVVMASGGYPGKYRSGLEIQGLEQAAEAGCSVFHAGTIIDNGQLLSAGGRVLAVTAVDEKMTEAVERAYRGIAAITFTDAQYRSDIGQAESKP